MSDQTPLDAFEQITSSVVRISPFEALWNSAEEQLQQDHPEGFNVEDIGRAAFAALPESEKTDALDELFYNYWSATMADRDTRANIEAGEQR